MLHTQNISSIYDGYSNIQNIQNTLITELSERVTWNETANYGTSIGGALTQCNNQLI